MKSQYNMPATSVTGRIDGEEFLVVGTRFGRFIADGNVTIAFPKSELGQVTVQFSLAPQPFLSPMHDRHLCYPCIVYTEKEVENHHLDKFVGLAAQILDLEDMLLRLKKDATAGVQIDFIYKNETNLRTDEDVANGVWPVGVLMCVPVDEEHVKQMLELASAAAYGVMLYGKAASPAPAPAGTKVH